MTDEKLLPCPFCGGQAALYGNETRHPNTKMCRVHCAACEASGANYATRQEAAHAWNTRLTPPTDERAEAHRLLDALIDARTGYAVCDVSIAWRDVLSAESHFKVALKRLDDAAIAAARKQSE
jgi:Lar family restriction alleviation protein